MLGPQLAAIVYGALSVIGLFVCGVIGHEESVMLLALATAAISYAAQVLMLEQDDTLRTTGLYVYALAFVSWIIGAAILVFNTW